LLLALLPVPPKKGVLTASAIAQVNTVIQEALHDILHPLEAIFSTGMDVHCGDDHIRHCSPRLGAWIADHMEYVVLLGLKTTSCPQCEVPLNELGDDVLRAPTRDYAAYEEMKNDVEDRTEAEKLRVNQQLKAIGVNGGQIALCNLYGVRPETLHKPDLLHGIYKGVFENALEWLMKFFQKYKRMNSFDEVWCGLPTYPGFSPFHRSYTQITQWQALGKNYGAQLG
jgi:hypothetical protein